MVEKLYTPFSLVGIKKNPSVLPVIGCIVLGSVMAVTYLARLAIKNPDVTWNSKKKPFPQEDYANKHYKFIQSEPFDIKNYKHPRPPF